MRNKVSICIIGTEITRGIICDTHTIFLTKILTEIGYEVQKIVTVPDSPVLTSTLNDLLKISDILIITGGLGPTCDDITRYSISEVVNSELEINQEALSLLENYINRKADNINIKQALLPKGFKVLENTCGTACGFYNELDNNKLVIALPGPPNELRNMFNKQVINILESRIGVKDNNRDEYSIYLVSESKLESLCEDFGIKDVAWATRVQEAHISLYISGKNKELLYEKLLNKLTKFLVVKGNIRPTELLKNSLIESSKKLSCKEEYTDGIITSLINKEKNKDLFYDYSIIGNIKFIVTNDVVIKTYIKDEHPFFDINNYRFKYVGDSSNEHYTKRKTAISAILVASFILRGYDVIDINNNTDYYLNIN